MHVKKISYSSSIIGIITDIGMHQILEVIINISSYFAELYLQLTHLVFH